MSIYRRPPLTRTERLVDHVSTHAEGYAVLGMAPATILLIAAFVAFTAGNLIFGVVLAVALGGYTGLVVSLAVLVDRASRRISVEIGGDYYDTKAALVSAREVWDELPAYAQEQTRPIINAAYQAATLPQGAQHAVEQRLALLRQFKDRVDREATHRAQQLLGEDDLEHGRALLAALDEVWRAQVPEELPAPQQRGTVKTNLAALIEQLRKVTR